MLAEPWREFPLFRIMNPGWINHGSSRGREMIGLSYHLGISSDSYVAQVILRHDKIRINPKLQSGTSSAWRKFALRDENLLGSTSQSPALLPCELGLGAKVTGRARAKRGGLRQQMRDEEGNTAQRRCGLFLCGWSLKSVGPRRSKASAVCQCSERDSRCAGTRRKMKAAPKNQSYANLHAQIEAASAPRFGKRAAIRCSESLSPNESSSPED